MNLLIIDLDGTITKSDNIIGFSFFILRREKKLRFLLLFPLLFLLKFKIINNIRFKTLYSFFILRKMEVSFLADCVLKFVKSESFQKDINTEVIDFIRRQTDTENLIISTNYDFIAQTVSESLSIEQCKCINLDQDNGKYTGLISGIIPFGKGKVDIYLQFVKDKKFNKTIGIGDSKNDLLLLKNLDEGYMVKYNSKNNSTSFELVSK